MYRANLFYKYTWVYYTFRGPGSSVGIKNELRDGSGSKPGGGRDFSVSSDRSWGPPSLLYNGYRVFPGGKLRPGRVAENLPPSSGSHGRIELYLYPTSGPQRACNGNALTLSLYYTLQSHVKCDSMLIRTKNVYVIINIVETFFLFVTFAIFQGKNLTAVEGYLV
jgi:hypothetical protein